MMKNLLSILFTCLIALTLSAQSFSDDFESYTPGDYLGPNSDTWTTWTGAEGTAEDVRVVDDMANSGTNSIHFVGSGSGGPADVILPFPGRLTSGTLKYKSSMYVTPGRSAYFNFQGNVNPGSSWTMNLNCTALGAFEVDDASEVKIRTSYPIGEWFDLEIEVNLTQNIWDFKINGDCVGSYKANDNAIASVDLYPLGDSDFYVDDVSFDYTEEAADAPVFDAGISGTGFGTAGLTGTSGRVEATVTNVGTEFITSFDVTYSDGVVMETQTFDNIGILEGQSMDIVMDVPYTYTTDRSEGSVTLSNINGMGEDELACNNVLRSFFTVVTPVEGKAVLVEEGTGTWCQWCPRGDVFMRRMNEKYPDHFVPVAVHNGDPMVNPNHDGFNGFTGYPDATVMRNGNVDPSGIEEPILTALTVEPFAYMTTGARYNEDNREMEVSITVDFPTGAIFDYKLAVIITEDEVTGTGNGYAQSNAYAGGGNGVMGGYENLPNPVPASQMVYEFVSRAILGGFNGISMQDFDLPAGDSKTYNFSYTIPADYNTEHLFLNPIIISPGGVVDNASRSSLQDAIDQGFVLSSTEDPVIAQSTYVYPNPFSDVTNVELNLENSAEVQINVIDAMGKMVSTRNYGQQTGNLMFPVDAVNLSSGVYYIHIYVDDKFTTKRIVVQK